MRITESARERLAERLKVAREHDDNSLRELLHRILDWELNAIERGEYMMEMHVHTDWEKNSFGFSENYPDNPQRGIVGGILFHGYDDQTDNSGAVCIDGPARGYRMHT